MANNYVPLEEEETKDFHNWLLLKGIPHTHIPNEIGGSTPAMKARALKMKRMGTSKGFPDLLVFIPVKNVDGNVETYQPLAIEMKRRKGSATSAEQKKWLEVLDLAGIPGKVCKGAADAVDFVEGWARTIKEGLEL